MSLFKKNKSKETSEKEENIDQLEENISEEELEELTQTNSEIGGVNLKNKDVRKQMFKFLRMILLTLVIFIILFWVISKTSSVFNLVSEDEKVKKTDDYFKQEISQFKNEIDIPYANNYAIAEEIANEINSDDSQEIISTDNYPVKEIKTIKQPTYSQAYFDRITPDYPEEQEAGEVNQKSSYAPNKAFSSQVNQDYLLSENTVIKCNLMTDVVSTIESNTKCLVLKNVYSDNGVNILIPKGSIASGKSMAGIYRGQKKMFVIWNKIKTPKGLIIPLENSQSVDKTGAIGHQAKIKSNTLLRFGNALLISVLETGIHTAFDILRDKKIEKVNIEVGQAEQNADMGIETLRDSIDIDAVGLINRGTIINILVSNDIDFSDVI